MKKGTRDIYVHVNVSKSTEVWPQRDATKISSPQENKDYGIVSFKLFLSNINCGFPIVASMIDPMSLEGQSNHGFNDWLDEACSLMLLNESGLYRYRKAGTVKYKWFLTFKY